MARQLSGLAVAYGPVEAQAMVGRALALSHLNKPEPIELGSDSSPIYQSGGAQ